MDSQELMVRPDLVYGGYATAANIALNERIKTLNKQGHNIFHLGFGQSPFPVLEVAVEALRRNAHQNSYLPVQGIPELRDGICAFHRHYDGLTLNSDNVIIGPGSKELFLLTMTVFNGDIVVNSPTWTTFNSQVVLSRHQLIVLNSREEDDWRITPEVLRKALTEKSRSLYKLLIFVNPCNPTGTSYTAQQLEDLTHEFRAHNILVISDEIYGRLNHNDRHQSLAKFYPEGTILSSGMSKWASAGGWRMGYHIYPSELYDLMSAVMSAASHSYTCTSSPMQYAWAEVLKDLFACDEYLQHTRRILRRVGQFSARELRSVGVKVVQPNGGFYIFPNFEIIRPALMKRGVRTGQEMCDLILADISVALLPGGPTHLRPEEELTTRLCFIDFDGKLALAESRKWGLDQPLDETFVREWCIPLYDGIVALRDWVNKLKQEN